MVDGKYSIVMQTPMGPVNGILTLKTDGEHLSGMLEAMGSRHPFTDGTVRGDECHFTNVFQTPLGKIQLSVKGLVQGEAFHATARTQMGVITALGKRVRSGGQRER